MAINRRQLGLVWVNLDMASHYNAAGLNRLGSHQGVVARSENGGLHRDDVATAYYLGQRLARFAHRLQPLQKSAQPADERRSALVIS